MTKRRPRTLEQLESRRLLAADVVINEIHYNPADNQSRSEFVELLNAGDAPADLAGWRFTDGIEFRFPNDTLLAPGEFAVVAEDQAAYAAEFDVKGPFAAYSVPERARGAQNFAGAVGMDFVVTDTITISSLGAFDSSSNGIRRDITVQLWSRDDAGTPDEPSDDRGAVILREVVFTRDAPGELIGGSRFKSLAEPLDLDHGAYTIVAFGYGGAERLLNSGAAGTGEVVRGDGRIQFVGSSRWGDEQRLFPLNIDVHPHQYGAGSFLFDFEPDTVFHFADGAYSGRLSNAGERITLRNAQGQIIDTVSYGTGFPWPTAASGDGPSMELIHPSLDNDLGGSWRSAGDRVGQRATPGQSNRTFSDNAPPQIRQVNVTPAQPAAGDDVVLTSKVTDADGVQTVFVEYQLVDPGDYIRKSDARYQTEWSSLLMSDDGTGADSVANDDVYSVTLPADLQTHRRLVRYRILIADTLGNSVRVPYGDDAQPNFAYFVYDGMPSWTGADRPGVTDPVTYATDMTRSLPAFHLISHESDVLDSNYNGRYNTSQFRFEGTLVVGDNVYDHIRYRIRGQNSTYVTGKNKWKLKFNRGHEFQGYDQYGNPWPEKLRTLNFGTNASPWAPGNRGFAGMDEAIAFRLFNMVDVAAPHASPFQLRVIDAVHEASDTDQYEGDLWGLYLAFENPSGDFLDSHDLPDGNLFRMQNSANELESHGFGLPGDLSDLNAFLSSNTGYNFRPTQPIEWWREHVDLDSYYSYRSVVEALNHSDIRDRENMLLYYNPDTAKWSMLPWDVDLLYEEFDRWGPDGVQNASQLEQFRKALLHAELEVEFQNRARELQDLLLNAEQGALVVEEYARYVEAFAAIDRAQWDYHPRGRQSPANGQHEGAFYNEVYEYPTGNGAAGEVRRAIHPVGFEGMVNWVKQFISQDGFGGGQLTELAEDPLIPATPTMRYAGGGDFPADDLVFEASAYQAGPSGERFAAVEWRMGRIHNPTTPAFDARQPWVYEVDTIWESGELESLELNMTVPPVNVSVGQTYRVRVRYKDATDRWSHWSEPVEFTAAAAANQHANDLRISEVHYNPSAPSPEELAAGFLDNDDFEFIEVLNTSETTVDLSAVQLDEGVRFSFGSGRITQLAPGERLVVVEDIDAFQFRFGHEIPLAGQWTGGLSNGGESLRLTANATAIQEFAYDDAWYPSTDGGGFSLELVDPLSPGASREVWRASSFVGGTPGAARQPLPGDSNHDGIFDVFDITLVFQSGKYGESLVIEATFEEGDWDGDGYFTSNDFVFAFSLGNYRA